MRTQTSHQYQQIQMVLPSRHYRVGRLILTILGKEKIYYQRNDKVGFFLTIKVYNMSNDAPGLVLTTSETTLLDRENVLDLLPLYSTLLSELLLECICSVSLSCRMSSSVRATFSNGLNSAPQMTPKEMIPAWKEKRTINWFRESTRLMISL